MIELLISLLITFSAPTSDATTTTKKDGNKTSTTTTQPGLTTHGGTGTWAEGTY